MKLSLILTGVLIVVIGWYLIPYLNEIFLLGYLIPDGLSGVVIIIGILVSLIGLVKK